jgi:malate dehydrogenase
VSLAVLGNPPSDVVIAWSTSTVGGLSLESLLNPPAMRRIDALASRLWPPGPYALATAATAAIDSIVSGSRPMLCCFAALAGELGVRQGVAAVPVLLGSNGVERILEPQLSVQERVRLGNATERL